MGLSEDERDDNETPTEQQAQSHLVAKSRIAEIHSSPARKK